MFNSSLVSSLGKCNWGNSCRFLHEKPKDVHKLSLHDRHGDPDVHGMLTDGPRVIPMGFHPGAGPMGHGIHPHGAPPPFMHGPGSLGLGECGNVCRLLLVERVRDKGEGGIRVTEG